MIPFVEWAGEHPRIASLHPFASHVTLCLSPWAFNNPRFPFLSVEAMSDGQLEFRLWKETGALLHSQRCPVEEAGAICDEFLNR
jgi:hypothetical protein